MTWAWLSGIPAASAAFISDLASRTGHGDRSPTIDITTGRYNCSDGDDITAELLDAISRYAPVANETGVVIYMPGDFELSGQIVFPAYMSPRGAGSRSATRLKCMTADAGLVIRSRGPKAGKFTVDGNSLATQPFYTDGVDRNFEDLDIRNSLGDGAIFENAQNCYVAGLGLNECGDNGLIFRNGASNNRIDLLRASGFNEYAIKQHQTVNQGAAYPNGLSGTILAQSPTNNKIRDCEIERLGTTVGGGTVGVGLGGVLSQGGSLYFSKPNFSIVPTTADTPTIDLDYDGFSTVNRVELDRVTSLGDVTHGIFVRIKDTYGGSRVYIRDGFVQAYRAVYRLTDTAGVIADMQNGAYITCTTKLENQGGGTKTYEQLVRGSRLEPIDFVVPAATSQAYTIGVSGESGYRLAVRGDGVYHMDGTTFTPTNMPSTKVGTGSPEGVVTGRIGSHYHRIDGGAGTSFYVKESGTGVTGWVAK